MTECGQSDIVHRLFVTKHPNQLQTTD